MWEEDSSNVKGWTSRRQISMRLFNCKAADSPEDDIGLLKQVLRNCPSDRNWDVSKPFQKAMLDNGEFRYYFVDENLTSEHENSLGQRRS